MKYNMQKSLQERKVDLTKFLQDHDYSICDFKAF